MGDARLRSLLRHAHPRRTVGYVHRVRPEVSDVYRFTCGILPGSLPSVMNQIGPFMLRPAVSRTREDTASLNLGGPDGCMATPSKPQMGVAQPERTLLQGRRWPYVFVSLERSSDSLQVLSVMELQIGPRYGRSLQALPGASLSSSCLSLSRL